ncbi:(deoxy)nucleoside triphosphate pyrophosphohydrolase [Thermodesulfobacteriota bacterium]
MNERTNKPNINVTAAMIWKDGRLLITKRPEGSHLAGLWEFPGGKQKANEILKECLEREIKEELGMDIRADEFLLTVQHEYDTKLVNLHLFQCSYLKGFPEALEGQEIKWVTPEDLQKYAFPPPDREIIERLF